MPHKFAPALGPSWMQVRHFREKYDDPAVTKPGERLGGAHPSSLHLTAERQLSRATARAETVALSGRIISKRRQGGICFLDLQGATPRSSAGAQITCLTDCASRR